MELKQVRPDGIQKNDGYMLDNWYIIIKVKMTSFLLIIYKKLFNEKKKDISYYLSCSILVKVV